MSYNNIEPTANCFECDVELIIEDPEPDKSYVCDECIEKYIGVEFY